MDISEPNMLFQQIEKEKIAMMKLEGIMTALVTPLKQDGTVDEGALKALIEYQVAHKVNSLLLLGGTGEYTSMTMEERFRAVDITIKAVNKPVPLIVGVLEPGVGECLKFCKYCRQARGGCHAGTDPLLHHGHPGRCWWSSTAPWTGKWICPSSSIISPTAPM